MPTLATQPINDWQLALTPNADSTITVDFVQTPTGDLALVNGTSRLVQSVLLWLLTPLGANPWDPNYGNPYYAQLGRPIIGSTTQVFSDMLNACEQAFLLSQTQAYQAGQLTNDEMVDHFADNQVTVTGPGQVMVSFTVVAASGTGTSLAVPFSTYTSN